MVRKMGSTRLLVCGGASALAFMLTSSSARAQNLLADPGFEVSQGAADASTGDQFGANGWNVFGGGTYTASDLFDGAPAHTGDQTFKTFGAFNGGFQQFTVTPGQTYTATVWGINSTTANNGNDVEAAGTVAQLELNLFTDASGDGAFFNTTTVITGGGPSAGGSPLNTWEEATITLTVPAGFNTARFQINQSVDNGGAAYWDDASLSVVPEPASLGLLSLAALPLLRRRRA